MARLLDLTGGIRCQDCDEMIPVERVRTVPQVTRCVLCQVDRNRQLALMFKTLREDGAVISSAMVGISSKELGP
jgi:hypothetical protein